MPLRDRQTDRHTDITNIVVTLAGAREPTRTNVSKSHVLKVLSSPEEQEQEEEEEERKKNTNNNNFRYFVTCLD